MHCVLPNLLHYRSIVGGNQGLGALLPCKLPPPYPTQPQNERNGYGHGDVATQMERPALWCAARNEPRTLNQDPATGGQDQVSMPGAKILQSRQRCYKVTAFSACNTQGQRIAAQLPLVARLARNPMHGGVIEEQCLQQHLKQIGNVVQALEMCQ